MPAIRKSPQFTVAPFGIDGAPEGRGIWKVADLSPKWIGVFSDLIRGCGETIEQSLAGALNHFSIKCALANGAAFITISVHDRPVSLGAFASGKSPQSDVDALVMFGRSLAVATSRFHASEPEAFEALSVISDRPLLAVVPWPDALVSEQEHDVAREIILHFSAALLFHI